MDQLASYSTESTQTPESVMDIHTLVRPGLTELFVTATSQNGNPYGIFADALKTIKDNDATVVSQHVFAPIGDGNAGTSALDDVAGRCDWPVTWIDSGHKKGSHLAGTQFYAVIGADVERVEHEGRIAASVFEDADARYCHLGDMRASDISETRPEQTQRTFDLMETVLDKAGMDFSNVIRTWIYLEDLLDWYDPFNVVRTKFFKQRGVFDRLVPASTGISGANPHGAAMMASALGVAPKNGEFTVQTVDSPLQCPAPAYGSSFSRGVEFGTPDCRRLSISGTASIAPGGETVYLDDVPEQIKLTFEVVAAILESRKMDWGNVAKAMAYLKDASYITALNEYCTVNDVEMIPFVITENHVCRHDLLFEMELDAVAVGVPMD
jgi:enamine deaminase RidA (YjgF/YER057c/UK114 family)